MGNKSSSKLSSKQLNDLLRRTTFTEKEIHDWHKYFHRDCRNGQLTLDDFKKIYGQFFHCGDPSAFAEHVFRGFDINRDKKISFNEFLISLNITAKGNLEDKLRWTFHLYDIDEDKFISRDEMLEIVRSIYLMVGPIIQWPEDELTPEARTDKIFHMFDVDRDDKLSYDEFTQVAQSDRFIVNLLNENRNSAHLQQSSMIRFHT